MKSPKPGIEVWAAAAAGAAAAVFFWPVLRGGFVNWDDPAILLTNLNIQSLGWPQLRWMATSFFMTTYQPLGWLALAVIHHGFGLDPGAYHAASLLVHAINAGLLCRLSCRLISPAGEPDRRTLWTCAAMAALWGLHPIQAQSVAWASELPDLLATTFFLASLLVYLRRRTGLSWLFFATSLLCRWKGISLPIALLAVDLVVLKRAKSKADLKSLLVEKAPFFFAALAAALINADAKASLAGFGHVATRPYEACVGFLFYLWKALWPVDLVPLYALNGAENPLGLSFAAAALLVLGLTTVFIALGRRAPALLAVWVCYLAAIAPPLLFSQEGPLFAMDHYAYLSTVGLAPLAAAGWLALRRRSAAWALGAGLAAAVAGSSWAALSLRQSAYWKDSITLWTHTLACDPKSYVAGTNLGAALFDEGRIPEAVAAWRRHLQVHPDDKLASQDLQRGLAALGAVKSTPAHMENNVGIDLFQRGKIDEALVSFAKALALDPRLAATHDNMAIALYSRGRFQEALQHSDAAVRLEPRNPDFLTDRGTVQARLGRLKEAEADFKKALKIAPKHAKAQGGLTLVNGIINRP